MNRTPPGWFVIETDSEGRGSLAHWNRYASEAECSRAIPRLNIGTSATGPLAAQYWDGQAWSNPLTQGLDQ